MDVETLISSIYSQIAGVKQTLGIMPNTIILGTQMLEAVITYTREIIFRKLPDKNSKITMFGIPVVIDDVDVNRVSVCVSYDVPICYKEVNDGRKTFKN